MKQLGMYSVLFCRAACLSVDFFIAIRGLTNEGRFSRSSVGFCGDYLCSVTGVYIWDLYLS